MPEHIDRLLALDPGLTEPGRVDAAIGAYLPRSTRCGARLSAEKQGE